ncbi:MAG: hypothetical protein VZR73_16475 [Acutalibacteraceae bacterium]|nr:hypothetical protein [Acutalibacteraceae bacterium]
MDVQDIKGIVLHIIGCLLIFYSGFMFGRATLPDHGNGTGEVRQELDRVEEYQRQAEDRVRDIEKTTGSVADAIDGSRKTVSDAQGAAGRIEADAGRAGAVIAECQQIIAAVRTRGTVKAP